MKKRILNKKPANSYYKILSTVIIATAVVFFWRGVWGIADVYLFPENYLLSSWISALVGFIILVVMGRFVKNFAYD